VLLLAFPVPIEPRSLRAQGSGTTSAMEARRASTSAPSRASASICRTFLLGRARPDEVAGFIRRRRMRSPELEVVIHPYRNAVVVWGARDAVQSIAAYIEAIDPPARPIRIDATILEASPGTARRLGLDEHPHPGRPAMRARTVNGAQARDLERLVADLEREGAVRVLSSLPLSAIDGERTQIRIGGVLFADSRAASPDERAAGPAIDITPGAGEDGSMTASVSMERSMATQAGSSGLPTIPVRDTVTVRLDERDTGVLGAPALRGDPGIAEHPPRREASSVERLETALILRARADQQQLLHSAAPVRADGPRTMTIARATPPLHGSGDAAATPGVGDVPASTFAAASPAAEYASPVKIRTLRLRFATPQGVASALRSGLSKDRHVLATYAIKRHRLTLRGDPESVAAAEALAVELDAQPRQVHVETRWIVADARQLLDLAARARGQSDRGGGVIAPTGPAVDLASRAGRLLPLRSAIDALVRTNLARTQTHLFAQTLEGTQANVFIGDELRVPRQTAASPEVIRFGLSLKVTPHIERDGILKVDVLPEESWVRYKRGKLPSIHRSWSRTILRIQNGGEAIVHGLPWRYERRTARRRRCSRASDLRLVVWIRPTVVLWQPEHRERQR
jgi:hypothetical protein